MEHVYVPPLTLARQDNLNRTLCLSQRLSNIRLAHERPELGARLLLLFESQQFAHFCLPNGCRRRGLHLILSTFFHDALLASLLLFYQHKLLVFRDEPTRTSDAAAGPGTERERECLVRCCLCFYCYLDNKMELSGRDCVGMTNESCLGGPEASVMCKLSRVLLSLVSRLKP